MWRNTVSIRRADDLIWAWRAKGKAADFQVIELNECYTIFSFMLSNPHKSQIVWKYCSEDWISHKTADSCCFIYSEHIFCDKIYLQSFFHNCTRQQFAYLFVYVNFFFIQSKQALRSQQSLSNILRANLPSGACPIQPNYPLHNLYSYSCICVFTLFLICTLYDIVKLISKKRNSSLHFYFCKIMMWPYAINCQCKTPVSEFLCLTI